MTLKEDYPHEKDPEHKLYKDYKAWNILHEYEAMKPALLTDRQNNVLSLFYKCRQYAEDMKRISLSTLKEFCQSAYYETDILIYAVQELDYVYLDLCFEKQKRDLDKLKKGGK